MRERERERERDNWKSTYTSKHLPLYLMHERRASVRINSFSLDEGFFFFVVFGGFVFVLPSELKPVPSLSESLS